MRRNVSRQYNMTVCLLEGDQMILVFHFFSLRGLHVMGMWLDGRANMSGLFGCMCSNV